MFEGIMILGFGLWGILGLSGILFLGILSTEFDSAIIGTATLVAGILVANYVFGIQLGALIAANPLLLVGIILGYIAIGAAYTALWRWPNFIESHDEKIHVSYMQWAGNQHSSEDNSYDAFLETEFYDYQSYNHKERLMTWTGMWPFALAWELARKPAIWVFKNIYKSLGNVFQLVSKRTARKLANKRAASRSPK